MTDANANAQPAERLAGFPCWIELYSPDIDASAAFYRDLLGWEITRAEPDEPLTTEVHHDGRLIGSFEPAEDAPGDSGWRVSFMVDDVGAAAGAAERAGGSVVVEPTDVTETMAYALASDPDGNVVGLLEDEDCEGPYPYQAGMPVWFDVLASDLEPAERFYRETAGWPTRRLTIGDQEQAFYTSVVGGRSVCGVGQAGYFGEEVPSRWRIYFGVEDADAAARRVRELGGAVIVEPIDFTFGRMWRLPTRTVRASCSPPSDPREAAGRDYWWSRPAASGERGRWRCCERAEGSTLMAGHGPGYPASRPSTLPPALKNSSAAASSGPSSARIRSVCHGRIPPSPKTSWAASASATTTSASRASKCASGIRRPSNRSRRCARTRLLL